MRKFVDSWEDTECKKPVDVNFDYYCPVCKIRWSGSPGPHYFAKKEGINQQALNTAYALHCEAKKANSEEPLPYEDWLKIELKGRE